MMLVLAVVIIGCHTSLKDSRATTLQPNSPMTVEEALGKLKSLIDATAKAIAPTYVTEPDNGFQTTPWEGFSGNTNGTVSAPYSLKISVPIDSNSAVLFARAKDYWERNGFEIGNDNLTTSDPRLHASLGDFQVELHIPAGSQFAYLDGGTPCLHEAKK